MALSLVHLQRTWDCSATQQGLRKVWMPRRVRAAQSQVPNLLLSRGTRTRMQHISFQLTNPPASGIMCCRTNGKHSIERPASWFGLTSLREPRGPVTSKYYANTKPWHNWVTFCSGSNCYCKCIFIRTIPASSVSQTSVKIQGYISTAPCQVKGLGSPTEGF